MEVEGNLRICCLRPGRNLTTKFSPDYILMIFSFFDFFGGILPAIVSPECAIRIPHSACCHPDLLIFYTKSFLYDHHLHLGHHDEIFIRDGS